MPKVMLVRREPWTFAPHAQFDYDELAGIALGSVVKANITTGRSGEQHRFYWGLVRKVWGHQERYETPEDIDALFKYRTGLTRTISTRRGDVITRPGSIAFDKMEQAAFHRYVQQVEKVVTEEILHKVKSDELRKEIMDYLGLPSDPRR